MRYAIFSDVHGNLEALKAVLEDIEFESRYGGRPIDQIWCLGDVVGYGPEPSECVDLVRRRTDICIPGNHDWVVVGRIAVEDFSEAAAHSAHWTRNRLTDLNFNYLKALPEVSEVGDFSLRHGSPMYPIWEYLTTADSAAANFPFFETRYCVVGHTHLPTIFLQPIMDHVAPMRAATRALMRRELALTMATPGGPTRHTLESGELESSSHRHPSSAPCNRITPEQGYFQVPPGYRAIINPGSVGQPRDGNPQAAYMIYDSERGFDFRRVMYDIGETQRKIYLSDLPYELAERLATGT